MSDQDVRSRAATQAGLRDPGAIFDDAVRSVAVRRRRVRRLGMVAGSMVAIIGVGGALALASTVRSDDGVRAGATLGTTAPPSAPLPACLEAPASSPTADATQSPAAQNGVAWPGEFDLDITLKEHFGSRYVLMWLSTYAEPDAADQRLVVAIYEPAPGDAAWVTALPYVGTRSVVVPSARSAAELTGFSTAVTGAFPVAAPLEGQVGSPPPTADPSAPAAVTIVGLSPSVRAPDGHPVVEVGVSRCDASLLQELATLVPADALVVRETGVRVNQ